MKYAGNTQKNRNVCATKSTKTNTATKSANSLFLLDAERKGCNSGAKGQKATCSNFNASNAFLKVDFAPKLLEIKGKNLERDFFTSLSSLAKEKNLSIKESNESKPLNIISSFQEVIAQLKNNLNSDAIRLMKRNNRLFFVEEIYFNTGYYLYYIPIFPLYSLIQTDKKTADLLLSVYAYLYKVTGVAYYRYDDTYMFSMYDMIYEFTREQEEEEEDIDFELLEEIKLAETIGDSFLNELNKEEHLLQFENRVNSFIACSEFESQSLEIAKGFLQLFLKFPDSRIDSKMIYRTRAHDDYEHIVEMDAYVSFIASNKGRLFNMLYRYINENLQDFDRINEPVKYHVFGLKNVRLENNNFDFEEQVFDLITRLIDLYNN